MLSYQASERPWSGRRKQGYISSTCFLQMPFISTESSPLSKISLTLSTSKKMSSNILLAYKRRKLSWNQLLTFITLYQSQKERKIKIQHNDVNKVEKTNQGKHQVTFVDTAKITQPFAFIHASVFIIKTLG